MINRGNQPDPALVAAPVTDKVKATCVNAFLTTMKEQCPTRNVCGVCQYYISESDTKQIPLSASCLDILQYAYTTCYSFEIL